MTQCVEAFLSRWLLAGNKELSFTELMTVRPHCTKYSVHMRRCHRFFGLMGCRCRKNKHAINHIIFSHHVLVGPLFQLTPTIFIPNLNDVRWFVPTVNFFDSLQWGSNQCSHANMLSEAFWSSCPLGWNAMFHSQHSLFFILFKHNSLIHTVQTTQCPSQLEWFSVIIKNVFYTTSHSLTPYSDLSIPNVRVYVCSNNVYKLTAYVSVVYNNIYKLNGCLRFILVLTVIIPTIE